MDSDSDDNTSPTARRSDDGDLASARGQKGRVRVLQLEPNDDQGEEDDRVGELNAILAGGGMMSTGNIERRKHPPSQHTHTLSAPTLNFPSSSTSASSSSSTPIDLSTIPPPPDKSGWLYKRGNLNSSWKKRWFAMRYCTLKYFKRSGDSKSKGFIPLSAAVVTEGTTEKMRRLFGFEISSLKYSRVFVIHADSEQEMKEWISALQKNIEYISLVIERERMQRNPNASPSAEKPLSTLASQSSFRAEQYSAQQKRTPEQRLQLEMSEEYLKSTGIMPRMSAWRRETQRAGLEESQAKLVHSSGLKSSLRLPATSCFAVHNTSNMIAVGLGSTQETDIESGAIQLIKVDTRDTVASLTEVARFGGEIAELASKRRATRKSTEDRKLDDLSSVASMNWPCAGEVASMQWVDQQLFVGSSGGVVAHYQLPSDLSSLSGHQPAQFLQHDKASTIPLAAPGKWLHTSRIVNLEVNPIDKKTLLTLANSNFFVWDLERGVQVAAEIGSAHGAPIFAGAWNLHGANEFVFGGEEGALRLLDTRLLASSATSGDRSKCVPWLAPRAHTDVIRSVSWSPLVPHWFASAGDDGLVKVWDMRFGTEPVRTLSGHTNAVQKVGWSKSHCEMLVSASSDKTARVWNMRVGPHYTVYTHSASSDDFSGPLVHASFSPVNPYQFFCGSTNGETVAFQMQRELIGSYVVHRNLAATTAAATSTKKDTKGKEDAKQKDDSKQKVAEEEKSGAIVMEEFLPTRTALDEAQEREISTLLYLRDLDRGFKAVANLAQRYWQQGHYAFANQLVKLTGRTLFEPAALEPSKNPPQANTMKVFNALLTDLCRFLPPKSLELTSQDEQTRQRIEFLGLRLMVADRIQAGQYQGILAMSDKICRHLAMAPSSSTSPTNSSGGNSIASPAASLDALMDQFDAATLERMALTILPHDHIRGLDFCLRIAETLKHSGNFSLFIGIARVVFNPTIYERMEEGSSAAVQYSFIRTLSTLAHTPIGGQEKGHREESKGNESESDSESSTNSVSSSAASRKPSDVDTRQRIVGRPTSMSVSTAAIGGAVVNAPPSTTNARGSVTVGNEVQHAQITLDRDLRNPKIVLSQLTLLREMLELISKEEDASAEVTSPKPATAGAPIVRFNPYLSKQHPSIAARTSLDTLGLPPLSSAGAKEIARLYEELKEPHKLLPSILHFLYFHALMSSKKYDLLFIAATKIGSNAVLKSYQFANVTEGAMNELTVVKFERFLQRLANKDGSSSASSAKKDTAIGSNLTKLQAASLTIINMLYNMDYLPDKLDKILGRYFREFHEELKRTLTEIKNNPSYVPSTSYSTARADCKAKAEAILSQIARIRTHSKIVGEPHYHEAVVEFSAMLKKFSEQ